MILNAKNLSKSYRNGAKELSVFNNLSLEVERGDLITIMGPSGAGKSTLLNILGTLDRSDSGTLILDNQNIDTLNNNQLAHLRNSLLGFVFQFHFLIKELTVCENVALPLRKSGVPEKEALRKAKDVLRRLGLDDKCDRLANKLSGGEQQRVAIARALVHSPALLLADEPTGNLDTANSERVFQLLVKFAREEKIAVILVTHNPEIADNCDHIISMKDGKIITN